MAMYNHPAASCRCLTIYLRWYYIGHFTRLEIEAIKSPLRLFQLKRTRITATLGHKLSDPPDDPEQSGDR